MYAVDAAETARDTKKVEASNATKAAVEAKEVWKAAKQMEKEAIDNRKKSHKEKIEALRSYEQAYLRYLILQGQLKP